MSFALFAAVVATFLSIPTSYAQDDSRYTVWSTVIFSRTGERTPATLGGIPTQLTSLGAQQQFTMGQFFRERYLTSMGSSDGVDSAPISGMNPNIPNWVQMYAFGLDYQYTLAAAQAFMQGFYPPFQLVNNATEVRETYDPTSVLANTSYVRCVETQIHYKTSTNELCRLKILSMATNTHKSNLGVHMTLNIHTLAATSNV
jgi:hypothetical protein